jgi:hypothetical protein
VRKIQASSAGAPERRDFTDAEIKNGFLPVDTGDFTFYDCAYEELLQALGAIKCKPPAVSAEARTSPTTRNTR